MEKGVQTRDRIVERAFRLATRDGIEGLSLGTLASDLGMSKSGLFAHFASKEEMQLEVLRTAAARFETHVVRPALQQDRGLPRLTRLFRGWMEWLRDPESSGCVFIIAATEMFARESHVPGYLGERHEALIQLIARLVRGAVDAGELHAGVDTRQIAFEIHGIVLAAHFGRRLLRDPEAHERAARAFERLLRGAAAQPKVA